MQLTKKLEEEIVQQYNAFWESNLGGQMETFASYLDDDFSIFGSANGEVFFNKADAVGFYAATVDQLAGKVQFRNRNMSIQPLEENSVIVRELSDVYVLIENEWTFYGNARITCIMKHTGGSWKAVHQHASFPDHRTEEGEQVAIEKISRENLELREAVKRRTIELENKTRELEIEASLEKVRAQALGMKKPEDLMEVCQVVYQELHSLGLKELRNAMINVYEEDKPYFLNYDYAPGSGKTVTRMPYGLHPLIDKQVMETRNTGDAFNEFSFSGKELAAFRELRKSNGEQDDPKLDNSASLHYYFYSIGTGSIGISTYSGIHADKLGLLKRFRNVFDFAYRRYMDVALAEAQAREAQIEASMERVRSRTMAMQKSAELGGVAVLLYNELKTLGVTQQFFETGYVEIDEVNKIQTGWTTGPDGNYLEPFNLPLTGEPVLDARYEAWKQRVPVFKQLVSGEELKRTIEFTLPYMGNEEAEEITRNAPDSIIFYCGNFEHGYLSINSDTPLGAEAELLLARFTRVFEMTYKRFLDLQKAEAQARETQIEVAVERVRARSMAMHQTSDLDSVNKELLHQLHWLKVQGLTGVSIMLIDEDDQVSAWDLSSPGNMGNPNSYTAKFDPRKCEVLGEPLQYLNQSQDYFALYYNSEKLKKGLEEWRDIDKNIAGVFDTAIKNGSLKQQWNAFARLSNGLLSIDLMNPPSEDTKTIVLKMAGAFNLAYKRFLDLQKAEFQTHQAKIETALEKVRARALAMQQPEELTEVARVMRHEMGLLGVEELETSSIYMHDEHSDLAECWYAIKDIREPEKKLIADHFILNLHDTWVGRQMFEFYQSGEKQVSIPMRGTHRKEWINYCSERSKLLDGFYGDIIPERTYHLYKFSNGTIGAATPGNISAESWDLLQRAASVFSLAYSRFKDLTQARTDLQRLKEEKQRAETALTELQTTQKQLIQSEKMASLGELTAGIAHEIQNPLNFVNNFSEVNKELLAEMNDEMARGNFEEVKLIAKDITDNEEKINHHGKRADAIVKGMLQHSRSGSGQKELTDLNTLADEYLRLAYHGLKARDKSFNAAFECIPDPLLPKVNVVPQDIGRVLLNLINNAFQAVNGYGEKPTVTVTTQQTDNAVEIRVTDNGPGIPDNIRDKIFQPFFTTKPTGQGTGLGLSLSYDIVKAHGGELTLHTKEGEGTTFIVQLKSKG